MVRAVRFMPPARLEVLEARDWYEQRAERLGDAFVAELDRQVLRISDNAEQFPQLHADIRRARLRRFPYSLFFRVVDDECFVLACFHASRDPRKWSGRR